jgi:hypothetical protein
LSIHFPGRNENEKGVEGFSKFQEGEVCAGQAASPCSALLNNTPKQPDFEKIIIDVMT